MQNLLSARQYRCLVLFSLIIAVVGGVVLGINNGELDLHWTGQIRLWAQAPQQDALLAFLHWFSLPYGGQLASILLIGANFGVWVFYLRQARSAVGLATERHLRRKKSEMILLAALLIALIIPVLKGAVARERPRFHKDNVGYTPWYDVVSRNRENPMNRGSFPSGHTLQAALLFALIFAGGRGGGSRRQSVRTKLLLTAMSLFYVALMGLSRIALDKHWLADVFFAALIGFWIVLFSFWLVFARLKHEEPLHSIFWRRAHAQQEP